MNNKANFYIGQIVHHQLFGYRGVIIDVDPKFMRSEKWYLDMAKSCPSKDQAWFRVLVHNTEYETYVADPSREYNTIWLNENASIKPSF